MLFKTPKGIVKRLKKPFRYRIDWAASSKSKFQTRIKNFLQPYWQYDIVFEELPIVGTRMSLDFYNANKRMAIEVQGQQHISYVKFFHGNKDRLREQFFRDLSKAQFCEINDIVLVEIYPNDKVSYEFFTKQGIHL